MSVPKLFLYYTVGNIGHCGVVNECTKEHGTFYCIQCITVENSTVLFSSDVLYKREVCVRRTEVPTWMCRPSKYINLIVVNLIIINCKILIYSRLFVREHLLEFKMSLKYNYLLSTYPECEFYIA